MNLGPKGQHRNSHYRGGGRRKQETIFFIIVGLAVIVAVLSGVPDPWRTTLLALGPLAVAATVMFPARQYRKTVFLLENLRDTAARAQFQLENTLSAMGTIYSQVLLLGVKDVDSARAQRLREDIAAAMDEVYHTSSSR